MRLKVGKFGCLLVYFARAIFFVPFLTLWTPGTGERETCSFWRLMFTWQTEIHKIIRFEICEHRKNSFPTPFVCCLRRLATTELRVWRRLCREKILPTELFPTIKNLNICYSRFNSALYTPLTPHTSELERRNISKAKYLQTQPN